MFLESPQDGPAEAARADGYVGSPGFFLLNQACVPLSFALGQSYLVGSATRGKGWRDVDVRIMMPDARYLELFQEDGLGNQRCNALWSLVCSAISAQLSHSTGLPVDFQIQSQSLADRLYSGKTRIPLGIYGRYNACANPAGEADL